MSAADVLTILLGIGIALAVARAMTDVAHPTASQARARRQFLRETEALVASVATACERDADGECATRRRLHRAVVEATRLPSGDARDAVVWEAMKAHEAHHCTIEGGERTAQQRLLRGDDGSKGATVATPVGELPEHVLGAIKPSGAHDPRAPTGEKPLQAGPVEGARKGEPLQATIPNAERSAPTSAGSTRMEIDRHVLELMGAAVVYGMRLERKAHPDAPLDTEDKIEEAERRMSEASAAFHRAMDQFTSPNLRHPHASV